MARLTNFMHVAASDDETARYGGAAAGGQRRIRIAKRDSESAELVTERRPCREAEAREWRMASNVQTQLAGLVDLPVVRVTESLFRELLALYDNASQARAQAAATTGTPDDGLVELGQPMPARWPRAASPCRPVNSSRARRWTATSRSINRSKSPAWRMSPPPPLRPKPRPWPRPSNWRRRTDDRDGEALTEPNDEVLCTRVLGTEHRGKRLIGRLAGAFSGVAAGVSLAACFGSALR